MTSHSLPSSLSLLLVGAPGSGKTQTARRVAHGLGALLFSLGDALRAAWTSGTEARPVAHLRVPGSLLDDDYVVEFYFRQLQRAELPSALSPQSMSLVTEGLPRTPQQVRLLSQRAHFGLGVVLECPEDVCLARLGARLLSGSRPDEDDEAVRTARVRQYNTSADGLYSALGTICTSVVRLDSRPSLATVSDQVLRLAYAHATHGPELPECR